jgi:predicted trehalose synthase
VAFSMSNVVVELPYITGAPLAANCESTMPPSTSQLCIIIVPARVMGVVPPDIAMERILQGTPARARLITISQVSTLSYSGLVGQVSAEIIGLSRSLS